MKFDNHIFISYSHIDNETDDVDPEGWVTRFDRSLQRAVDMKLGYRTKIWRDKNRLDDNQDFSGEIADQLPSSAVLISIVSKGYVNSPWCKKEAALFCDFAEQDVGLKIDNDYRIFKVEKSVIDSWPEFPQPFTDQLGTPFYTIEDNAPIVLEPHLEAHKMRYRTKMNRLADSVSRLIERIEIGEQTTQPIDANLNTEKKGKTVYLAECNYRLKEIREEIEEFLVKNGYRVLPDKLTSRDEETYRTEVEAALSKSDLSIHLIDSRYGAVPDGPSEKSIGEIQNELAVAQHKESGMPRIIWLPANLSSDDPDQQAFIDNINNDKETQAGASVVTDNLEVLKTAIHDELKKEKDSSPDKPMGSQLIYLACVKEDQESIEDIQKFLTDKGFEVKLPTFEGTAAEIRKANQEILANSDAVIIYYGAGKEGWRTSVELDLMKIRAKRATNRVLPYLIVLTGERTAEKEDLLITEEDNVLSLLEQNGEADFSSVIDMIASQANN